MSQRDVLLEGQATIQPGEFFRTAWIATQGLQKVAISAVTANQPFIEESRDGTNAFLSWGLAGTGNSHTEYVPGAAFIRLAFNAVNQGSPITVEYSLRGIG